MERIKGFIFGLLKIFCVIYGIQLVLLPFNVGINLFYGGEVPESNVFEEIFWNTVFFIVFIFGALAIYVFYLKVKEIFHSNDK